MSLYAVLSSFIVVVLLVDITGGSPFKTCGSPSSKVINVNITNCLAVPCQLKKGTNASFTIEFVAGNDYTKVKADVHGIIAGVPIGFPIPNPDGCKNSNLTCPLKKGQTYFYSSSIAVKTVYPNLQLVVKWELQDENSADIACVEIPAQIV